MLLKVLPQPRTLSITDRLLLNWARGEAARDGQTRGHRRARGDQNIDV